MKKIYLLLTLTILALSGCVDSGVEKRIKDLDNKLTTDLANGINNKILQIEEIDIGTRFDVKVSKSYLYCYKIVLIKDTVTDREFMYYDKTMTELKPKEKGM